MQNPLIVPVKVLKGHRVEGELGKLVRTFICSSCDLTLNTSFIFAPGFLAQLVPHFLYEFY